MGQAADAGGGPARRLSPSGGTARAIERAARRPGASTVVIAAPSVLRTSGPVSSRSAAPLRSRRIASPRQRRHVRRSTVRRQIFHAVTDARTVRPRRRRAWTGSRVGCPAGVAGRGRHRRRGRSATPSPTRSDPVQLVATVGAWCGWAAGALALAVPAVATLTAVRVDRPRRHRRRRVCLRSAPSAWRAVPRPGVPALSSPRVLVGAAETGPALRPGVGVRRRAALPAAPAARLPRRRRVVSWMVWVAAVRHGAARLGGAAWSSPRVADARGRRGDVAAPAPLAPAQPALAGGRPGRARRPRPGRARRDVDAAPPAGHRRSGSPSSGTGHRPTRLDLTGPTPGLAVEITPRATPRRRVLARRPASHGAASFTLHRAARRAESARAPPSPRPGRPAAATRDAAAEHEAVGAVVEHDALARRHPALRAGASGRRHRRRPTVSVAGRGAPWALHCTSTSPATAPSTHVTASTRSVSSQQLVAPSRRRPSPSPGRRRRRTASARRRAGRAPCAGRR